MFNGYNTSIRSNDFFDVMKSEKVVYTTGVAKVPLRCLANTIVGGLRTILES